MPPSSDDEVMSATAKYAKGRPAPSTESAPSSVAGFSEACALAPSAKEMWEHEQLQKKLAEQAERKRTKALEEELKAVKAELTSVKKRTRPPAPQTLPVGRVVEDEAPKKRPSPDPKPTRSEMT